MDGVKRAATVLGNALTSQAEVAFYSLAQPRSFYELSAPLITRAGLQVRRYLITLALIR